MVVPILPELRRKLVGGIFIVTVCFSVGVQIIGTFFYVGRQHETPSTSEGVWDWRNPQLRRYLGGGLAPTMYPQLVSVMEHIKEQSSTETTEAKRGILAHEFSQEISTTVTRQVFTVNEKIIIPVTVKNISTRTWLAAQPSLPGNLGPVRLSYRWVDSNKQYLGPSLRTALPDDLAPGESITFNAVIQAPNQKGDYILRITLVQERVAWFDDKKGIPLNLFVRVLEANEKSKSSQDAALKDHTGYS
jgi:hypothetical protein